MKNRHWLSFILLALYATVTICSDIHIATYNIRREGSEACSSRLWKNRNEQIVNQIKEISPDILCLQEVTKTQLNDLTCQLNTQYKILCLQGRGTAWGGMGTNEALPIFFNPLRFTPITSGMFRLNDLHTFIGHLKALLKPKSRGFLPRICTWAILKETTTGLRILVLNTHLDNRFEKARINMLQKIAKKTIVLKKKYTPDCIVLMGDFNSDIPGKLQNCIPQFINTRDICQHTSGPTYTHPGWDHAVNTNIDHIMLENSKKISVATHSVFDSSPTGILISDHWPVISAIRLHHT